MSAVARVRRAITSPFAWVLLGVVVVAALVVGSVHGGPTGTAARIAQLDSIIKCPSCDDLSIAQSQASTAVALRSFVAASVRSGESDAQVEDAVVARYGPGILLQPRSRVVWVLPFAAVGTAALLVGTVMWRRRLGPAPVPAAGAEAGRDDEKLVEEALRDRRNGDVEPA